MNKFNEVAIREKKFLDKLYSTYKIDNSSQVKAMRDLILKTFETYINGGKGLELGCSDGVLTEKISKKLDRLDVIEGSKKFIEQAKRRNLKVNFLYSLVEEFRLRRKEESKYDYVFAIYILEHVLKIEVVLKMIKSVLKPDGLLFVVVPNARALSRQLALHMGLINNLKDLTKNDINHGHRRVFDRVSLNIQLKKGGFRTIAQGGIMLKILADFQMNRLIDKGVLRDEHIEGLYSLGLEYPDLCGSLFSVCQIDNKKY